MTPATGRTRVRRPIADRESGRGPRPRVEMARPLAALAVAAFVALAGLAIAGCSGRPRSAAESAAADSTARVARAQALISAGNEAYRAGDFRLAARRYASAAMTRDDDPAAYYGLGMALSKLGRDEDARVAYARARELAARKREP